MRRSRRSQSESSDGHLSDGADLPLLPPSLLGKLSKSGEGPRTHTSEGDCLILSDDELSLFDFSRVDEVRHALSSEHAFSDWPGAPLVKRRRQRWEKILWAAVFAALAIGVGATIGFLL